MKKHTSLLIILIISIGGMLFSGYLSFTELIKQQCTLGGCSYMLGMPVCVYGLIMYSAVFAVSLIGFLSKK